MSQTMVCINNREIQPKEWLGQRVVTFQDIESVHDRPEGTAKRNFRANREHFIPNEDFFEITRDEFRTNFVPNSKLQGNPNLSIVLLTEYGYLMLVKSFTDDLAWSVQRELIKGYFKAKQETHLPAHYPLLDQTVYHLTQAQQNSTQVLIEHSYRLTDAEKEIQSLKKKLKSKSKQPKPKTITKEIPVYIFKDVVALYKDMRDNYQSFVTFQETNDNDGSPMIKNTMIFRMVELRGERLYFQVNKYKSTNMSIYNVLMAEKKNIDTHGVVEYKIYFEGGDRPIIFTAVPK